MKIVITMAGKGSRFVKQGYQQPKHEIIAGKHSLFAWAMHSLENFFDEEFIFLVRKDAFSAHRLKQELSLLGINKYSIIELTSLTRGQADTVLQAEHLITDEEGLVIYNIDTTVQPRYLTKEMVLQGDGTVPVFQAQGNHWSFAKLNRQNKIIELAEKQPISEWGSVGFYYFRYWKDYKTAFHIMKEEIARQYGEIYIAPLYNYLIQQGKIINPVFLPKNGYASLGTPEELTEFIQRKINRFEGDW
ncbi:glycosyltransferase family 2 protein [Enterococcus pallens]|uniref:Nucleotidyl transferase domain-containing protein n=1 Tax=Enterococcus pallens ATCC BAA-351 TaxID=1158607 RepID=R2Q7J9_9ENTE|nr:glycosyltransferase family 2 protein [Enterococcus pallens]EOH92467.1 hypothetical protein UAU_02919 [Enterococcus pallens ATCC BAA-351]EOU25052.1 hypothetical protein I588_01040 [Enterococcus pallens ATCC BAA-351]OJG76047.1 hypothetical protein RV10_GL004294 [Enterococcus pallens]